MAGLAMQDVQDYSQDSENEEGRKEKPLSQLVLQFAEVHGRTRLRAQRHRGETWGRSANPTLQACTESTQNGSRTEAAFGCRRRYSSRASWSWSTNTWRGG
jgi:hypothetical protein